MRSFVKMFSVIMLIAIVFAPDSSKYAQIVDTAIGNYPPITRAAEWQQEILDGKISSLYAVSDRLKKLPHEPWSEPWCSLLYNITQRHVAIRDSIRELKDVDFGDPNFKRRWLGEYAGNLVEMAAFQGDARFMPLLKEYLGSGTLPASGLAKIGEPAFEAITESLYKDGWSSQPNAAYALKLMLAQPNGFLVVDPIKRETAKQALLHAARVNFTNSKLRALDALVYFAKSPEVVTLIDSLSQQDATNIKGKYIVREKAQEALQEIQRNER